MKKRLLLIVTVLSLVFSQVVGAASTNFINTSIPTQVSVENNPTLTLDYQIYIENFAGGAITKVVSGVHSGLGTVTIPATTTYEANDGYWAAHYVKGQDGNYGAVSGTSVNAIHMFVGPNQSYNPAVAQLGPSHVWKPRLISILPSGETGGPGRISTNIAGGSQLFGGWSSVYVGSPVKYYNSAGQWRPIQEFYASNSFSVAPTRLMIDVYKPTTTHGTIDYIVFDNSVGGNVSLQYAGGFTKTIATVLQRVEGHGRFAGSEYAELGRVRANHGGVICLSTSNKTNSASLRGGFQIIPANHAKYLKHQLDTHYIGGKQWMIVGPLGSTPGDLLDPTYYDTSLTYDPAWEAIAPLFGMYIKPKQIPGSKATSTHFEVSKNDGVTWQDPDLLQGTLSDTSLADVTHVRIKLNY